jgi:glycosyltransferase involved in cell wall biosynthesis
MNIVNIMLGKGRGGIERSALDYAAGLQDSGANVLFVTTPDAAINASALGEGCQLAHLSNLGAWDWFAARRLYHLCREFAADSIIVHGNRSLSLAALQRYHPARLVAVAHNYQFQHVHKADATFCITEHVRQAVMDAHPSLAPHCYVMPNMIIPPSEPLPARNWHQPPRIGAMGRMVAKKGFDVWLHALARLQQRGIAFDAWLAGDGEERAALEALCSELGLSNQVTFTGWATDTAAFYRQLDLFCVPSHHEPFGIVVIEGMAAGLPVIATKSEGPLEIITEPAYGMLVDIADATAMADAMAQLLTHQEAAQTMGMQGQAYALATYNRAARCQAMLKVLESLLTPASKALN